ncbi:MAG: helix-turn-helix domain-containing protein [Actinophytocola sp.]
MQQRRLRSELRRLRESAGCTQKAAAAGLDWSISKIIRIETGAVQVSSSDVRAMLHFYGVSDRTKTDDLLAITRAKEEAWWDAYRSVYRQQFLDYLDYEDSATQVRQVISFVVPGLLQTEDYMRALFEGLSHDEDWIERAVQVRTRRQRILAPEDGKQAWFIIDEAALHRWIGGQEVTRRQFDHLREMAKQPNLSIRVVPSSVGMHPGIRASFTILDFASDDEDTIVSIENPDGVALIKDDFETTSEFVERFSILEDIATPEEESDAALNAVVDRMQLDTR